MVLQHSNENRSNDNTSGNESHPTRQKEKKRTVITLRPRTRLISHFVSSGHVLAREDAIPSWF